MSNFLNRGQLKWGDLFQIGITQTRDCVKQADQAERGIRFSLCS